MTRKSTPGPTDENSLSMTDGAFTFMADAGDLQALELSAALVLRLFSHTNTSPSHTPFVMYCAWKSVEATILLLRPIKDRLLTSTLADRYPYPTSH